MMKKILWVIGLIALVFVGDRIGGKMLQFLTNNSEFRYSRLYKSKAESDILLVGNSRGLVFYQPYIEEVTSAKTFNIGYNGMHISLARVLMEDYLQRHKAPKLVLFEVSMADYSDEKLIPSFALHSQESTGIDSLIFHYDPAVGWASKVSHLYRYNSEVFHRSLYYLNKSDKFWLLDRKINANVISELEDVENVTFGLKEERQRELKKIVALANQYGTEIRLVINPYFPPYADKITNLEEWKSQIEALTGQKIYDYTRAIDDFKSFADYTHLNKYGSKMYIEQLKRDKVFEVKKEVVVSEL
ncbi:MAG: hypothetical protein ACPG49_07175 [Chitinophagales bacterium]